MGRREIVTRYFGPVGISDPASHLNTVADCFKLIPSPKSSPELLGAPASRRPVGPKTGTRWRDPSFPNCVSRASDATKSKP